MQLPSPHIARVTFLALALSVVTACGGGGSTMTFAGAAGDPGACGAAGPASSWCVHATNESTLASAETVNRPTVISKDALPLDMGNLLPQGRALV